MKAVALLLLVGCAAPFKFTPPTHEAKTARVVSSWLSFCLRAETIGVGARSPKSCYQEADLECNAAGLPDRCYGEEQFFACTDRVERAAHAANPRDAMASMPGGCF